MPQDDADDLTIRSNYVATVIKTKLILELQRQKCFTDFYPEFMI